MVNPETPYSAGKEHYFTSDTELIILELLY